MGRHPGTIMLKSICILMFLIGVQCGQVTRRRWRSGTVSSLGNFGANNVSNILPEGYIAYGRQARAGEFPWMAAIATKLNDGTTWVNTCGGSLISDRHVLTAAHCLVTARYLEDITITVGDYNKGTFPIDCDEQNGCTRNFRTNPARVTSHQNYDRKTVKNDIAVLRLATHVNTDSFRPISLPPFDVDDAKYENAPLTVAGWGRTEHPGKSPSILRTTEVNLKTRRQCLSIYNNQYPERHLCAGKPDTRTSFCKGDSGGPLMMFYQNKFHVSGIVSFTWASQECGNHKVTYYTNVFKYMPWIKWAMNQ